MSTPLTLVQPSGPMPAPMTPEERANQSIYSAVQAAWQDGHGHGEHQGYIKGWRTGLLCGLCWGGLLVCLLVMSLRWLDWL